MTVKREWTCEDAQPVVLYGWDGTTIRRIMVDEYGNLLPEIVVSEGAIFKLQTTDSNNEQLLSDILKELKKMNLHLSLLTDADIRNQEVE